MCTAFYTKFLHNRSLWTFNLDSVGWLPLNTSSSPLPLPFLMRAMCVLFAKKFVDPLSLCISITPVPGFHFGYHTSQELNVPSFLSSRYWFCFYPWTILYEFLTFIGNKSLQIKLHPNRHVKTVSTFVFLIFLPLQVQSMPSRPRYLQALLPAVSPMAT